SPSYTASENDGAVTITLQRVDGNNGTLHVRLHATGLSATAGRDFSVPVSMVTFGPSETTKTITITLRDDGQAEARETVRLSLTVTTGDGTPVLAPSQAFLSIVDDDSRSGVSANEDFVRALYGDVLDREVDPIGLAAWSGLLDGGGSREEVV